MRYLIGKQIRYTYKRLPTSQSLDWSIFRGMLVDLIKNYTNICQSLSGFKHVFMLYTFNKVFIGEDKNTIFDG